ncbi:MAG: hypothetical protein RI958_2878 [Actinomycetota bacterium]|jgi:LPS sulfotransferase NodH
MGGGGVRRVIVVAASPRTGSSLLSEALSATGVAGAPQEYINPSILLRDPFGVGPVRWSVRGRLGRVRRRVVGDPRWDRPVPERFTRASVVSILDNVGQRWVSGDGVLSIKVMWGDYRRMMLDRGLDMSVWGAPVSWVWIRRDDRVRQAVSWSRALQTGAWAGRGSGASTGPVYDRRLIEACVRMADTDEAGWREHFSAWQGEPPLAVTYEALSGEYEATMSRVFDHLGVRGVAVPAPPLERMADELSEQWVTQFLAGGEVASVASCMQRRRVIG